MQSNIFNLAQKYQQMHKYMSFLSKLAFFLILVACVRAQCCLRFQGDTCAQCPPGMHLYRGNCLYDIKNCIKYSNGFDCQICSQGYQLNNGTGKCIVTPLPRGSAQSYTDTLINIHNSHDPHHNLFLLTNEYFVSLYFAGTTATVLAAQVREYKNGTAVVTIEYQRNDGRFYQGMLSPNLNTFTFTEKSFIEIASPTLLETNSSQPLNSSTTVPSPSQATIVSVEPSTNILAFEISNPDHFKLYQQIDLLIPVQHPELGGLKSGTVQYNIDGTVQMVMQYVGVVEGENYELTALFATDGFISLLNVKLLSNTSGFITTNLNDAEILGLNEPNLALSNIVYSPLDLNAMDPFYLITVDFVGAQVDRYRGLMPVAVEFSSVPPFNYYKLQFALLDGSRWEILANINTGTLLVSLQEETQLSIATIAIEPVFIEVSLLQVLKDVKFLFVLEGVSQESGGKYVGAKMLSVKKSQGSFSTIYLIEYDLSGVQWSVTAEIDDNMIVSNITQSQNSNIVAASTQTTESLLNFDSEPLTSTQDIKEDTFPSLTIETTSTETIETLPDTTTTSLQTFIVPQNELLPTTLDSTGSLGQTVMIKASPNGPLPQNETLAQNEPIPSKIPDTVAKITAGLSRLNSKEIKGDEFIDINYLLHQTNADELKDTELSGAFYSMQSFTRNYQIYYIERVSKEIYEARVSRDLLRKKTYVISFGKIGY